MYVLALLLYWLIYCLLFAAASPLTGTEMLRLRKLLNCHDRPYASGERLRNSNNNKYWLLQNYVLAEHGPLQCHESITYATHADYRYLGNLLPLLLRWRAPISLAIYAPGSDFQHTLQSIKWLRECAAQRQLVRAHVSFHIYFDEAHMPANVPKAQDALLEPLGCSATSAYANASILQTYRSRQRLLYPINVARNVAREAALTHFVLVSDIELYPTPQLVEHFFALLLSQPQLLGPRRTHVYVLRVFELAANATLPQDKRQLQQMLANGQAFSFHDAGCAACHRGPRLEDWMAANGTQALGVFHVAKRIGNFSHWEPIYIGTQAEPHYEERLSWEGRSDKMMQGYAMCVLDYEYRILDNAFLVHKPGLKTNLASVQRQRLVRNTHYRIGPELLRKLRLIYGERVGCTI